MTDRGLKGTYMSLSAVTAAALAYAALGIHARVPPPVRWQELQVTGYGLRGHVIVPAKTGRHVAHGDVVRLEYVPQPGLEVQTGVPGEPFVVVLAPMAARSHEKFYLHVFREYAPPFALQDPAQRKVLAGGPKNSMFDLGLDDERSAAQACISRTGLVTVDTEQMLNDIASWQASGSRTRIKQLLGMAEPIPWDCVLVSISVQASPGEKPDQASLGAHWQQFSTAWKSAKAWVPSPLAPIGP